MLLVILAATVLLTGCSDTETHTLRLGMMPAVDIAPFYHASESGIFDEHGLEVELVLFTNAQNRQTALQTNQIDGAMTDLVALATNVAGDFPLHGVLSTEGIFPLLVRDPADLAADSSAGDNRRPTIGVMEISITNYAAQMYLRQHHGDMQFEPVFINEIPTRLAAVSQGQVTGGIFPEPVASIGEANGLHKLVYPDIPRESLDIIAVTDSALQTKPEAIRALTAAYSQAAAELNTDPSLTLDILYRYIPNLPPQARELINLPAYRPAHLPSDGFLAEIIEWTEGVRGQSLGIQPADLVDRSYL